MSYLASTLPSYELAECCVFGVLGQVSYLASTLLTGCFEEKITCNEPIVQSLVKGLTQESVLNQVLLKKLKSSAFSKDNSSSKSDAMAQSMIQSGMMDGFYLMMIESLKYDESGKVNLKYKEINRVMCKATTKYEVNSETYLFDTS